MLHQVTLAEVAGDNAELLAAYEKDFESGREALRTGNTPHSVSDKVTLISAKPTAEAPEVFLYVNSTFPELVGTMWRGEETVVMVAEYIAICLQEPAKGRIELEDVPFSELRGVLAQIVFRTQDIAPEGAEQIEEGCKTILAIRTLQEMLQAGLSPEKFAETFTSGKLDS